MTPNQEPKYVAEKGRIFNRQTGEQIPDDEPIFIFRAKDKYAAKVLNTYARMVADAEHSNIVQERAEDFERFARENPERMGEPTTGAGDLCYGGGQGETLREELDPEDERLLEALTPLPRQALAELTLNLASQAQTLADRVIELEAERPDEEPDERLIWLNAWRTIAAKENCKTSETALCWADECLDTYRALFVEEKGGEDGEA